MAKKKRRRARKVGSLQDALKAQWQAVDIARQIMLDDESEDDKRLKAVHAVTQANAAFAKLMEIGELEARLSELEKLTSRPVSAAKQKNGHPTRAYA